MWGMRVCIVSVALIVLLMPAHAADIAVSASVPLSEQYKKRIQDYSNLSIQRKNRIVYISAIVSDGTSPIKGEAYDLLLVSDTGKMESRSRGFSADDGSISYVFIPDRSRSYTLFLINTAHSTPFLVTTAQI